MAVGGDGEVVVSAEEYCVVGDGAGGGRIGVGGDNLADLPDSPN